MALKEITIQTLTKEDAAAYLCQLVDLDNLLCRQLGVAFSEGPWDPSNFLMDVPRKWEYSSLAWEEGSKALVGYSICSEMLSGQMHIHRFGVYPQYQREGVGRMLMKANEEKAAENNARYITVETNRDNRGAIDFYIRNGFVKLEGQRLKEYARERKSDKEKIHDDHIEEPSGLKFQIFRKEVRP